MGISTHLFAGMTVLLAGLGLASEVHAGRPADNLSNGKVIGFNTSSRYRQGDGQFKRATPHNGVEPLLLAPERSLDIPRMPMKIGSGTVIYGWGEFNLISFPFDGVGLYTIGDTALDFQWYDTQYMETASTYDAVVLVDGMLYGPALQHSALGGISDEYWNVFTLDGDLVSSERWDIWGDAPVYLTMVYNPNDNCVYGQGLSVSYNAGNNLVFFRAPFNNPKKATVIREYQEDNSLIQLTSLFYREDHDCMYGVTGDGSFCKVGFDGSIEKLKNLKIDGYDINWRLAFGSTYVPDEKLVYMVPNSNDYSYVATFDMSDEGGQPKVLYKTKAANQILSLFIPDDIVADPLKPAKPVVNAIEFVDASLDGYARFTMPSKLVDGTPVSGDMVAYATVDDTVYKQFNVSPGESLRVDYTGIEQGEHSFGVYVVANGKSSRNAFVTKYVGYDTPKAPSDVTLTPTKISWSPVTEGVHGGYIDLKNLKYNVTVSGYLSEETMATSIDIQLPENEPIDIYDAEVYAINHGMESEVSLSNEVTIGQPLELPVFIEPTKQQSRLCSYLDNNEDGKSWSFYENREHDTMFSMGYSERGVYNDDWLFLPPVKIDSSDKYYSLKFESALKNLSYTKEYLEIWIGTSPRPEDMDKCIVERFTPMQGGSADFQHKDVSFSVDNPGVYYIGFQCVSDPYQGGMYLKDIYITDENMTGDSPSAVTDLELTGAKNGVLSATAAFTMPQKTIDGADIPAGTQITAVVSSSVDKKEVSGTPGEKVSATVNTVQGVNSIGVYAKIGDLQGIPVSEFVYTGVGRPATPTISSYIVSDDMLSLTINWNRVTTAAESDEYVNPDGIRYQIYEYVQSASGNFWEKIADNITDTSYTYTKESGLKMAYTSLGVAAVNVAGTSPDVDSRTALIGTPYSLPMEETFEGYIMKYTPWLIFDFGNDYAGSNWALSPVGNFIDMTGIDGISPDDMALVGGGSEGSYGAIGIPRFSTIGCNEVKLTMTVYTGPECADITLLSNVSGQSPSAAPDQLDFQIKPTDVRGFSTVEFMLPPSLMNKAWVQIYINAYYATVDNYLVIPTIGISGSSDVGESLQESGLILGGKGCITMKGFSGSPIHIYTPDGQLKVKGVLKNDNVNYSIEKGIYIVNVGSQNKKVMVK